MLLGSRFARQGGRVCNPETLLQGNDVLKTCLRRLSGQQDEPEEGYLQSLIQWDAEPVADEFTAPVTGRRVLLPRWLTQWCFADACRAGTTETEARLDSLLAVCARFALKQIVTRQLTPPKLERGLWRTIPEVCEAVSVLRSHGITVTFFDASCGADLPVVGAMAVGNGGGKLRAWAAVTVEEAVVGCMGALLEGCTAERFFTAAGVFTDQMPTREQLHNVLTTGEGYLPLSLLGENTAWAVPARKPFRGDPEAVRRALTEKLWSMGMEVYTREGFVDGYPVCQTILPNGGLEYEFGGQRLLEYRLRQVAVPILRSFADASAQEQALAVKYVAMKRNCLRQNSFSYLTEGGKEPRLFDMPVDGKLLMGLYYIHTGDPQRACGFFPDSSAAFRCLKALLRGQSPAAVKALYPAEAVAAVSEVLRDPLAVLRQKGACP